MCALDFIRLDGGAEPRRSEAARPKYNRPSRRGEQTASGKTRGRLITRPSAPNLGVPASAPKATNDFPLNPPLEPASPTVPATTKNENYEDDDDEKCCVVHVVLLRSEFYYPDANQAESLLKPLNCAIGEADTGLDRSSRIESLVRKLQLRPEGLPI
jgi:hypothetical protein